MPKGVAPHPSHPPAFIEEEKFFIPISLGNHYYSSDVLLRLFSEFIAQGHRSIIVLCDRLRLLSYMIRGEDDLPRINEVIKHQLSQMIRTLNNLGLKRYQNVVVADWSFMQDDSR